METEFINPNGKDSQAAAVPNSRRPNNLWLIIIAALFIIVPFLTWYLTWFGRALSDEDVATYLADDKNPRHMQHALSQVAERIERHDPQTKKFYPQVIALSKNPIAEIRKTTAWVMGPDNRQCLCRLTAPQHATPSEPSPTLAQTTICQSSTPTPTTPQMKRPSDKHHSKQLNQSARARANKETSPCFSVPSVVDLFMRD